jgi:hypothetical protein
VLPEIFNKAQVKKQKTVCQRHKVSWSNALWASARAGTKSCGNYCHYKWFSGQMQAGIPYLI